jgi:hypothetical protein
MSNQIRHKRSETAGARPTAGVLATGELAVNVADGKIFLKRSDNTVVTPVVDLVDGGEIEIEIASATLYFNGAVDGNWTTVGNWWLDEAHTEPAGRLPAETDSVVATNYLTASGQTVVNFTMNDPDFIGWLLSGTLTVTGTATFNGESGSFGTLNGNAVFNESAGLLSLLNGNAVFNDSSYIGGPGVVNGDATFNDSSANFGSDNITGTITDNR